MDKKLYFSLITGKTYEIEVDEIKNQDQHQVPLKKPFLSHCKKCYGRGYTAYNITHRYYIVCPRCIRACADFEMIKKIRDSQPQPIKMD